MQFNTVPLRRANFQKQFSGKNILIIELIIILLLVIPGIQVTATPLKAQKVALPGNIITLKKFKEKFSLQSAQPGNRTTLIKIQGSVTDSATGDPLVGVTIQVKGSTIGAVTDANGKYAITVSDDAVLVFSFIGYKTRVVPVKGRTEVNVSMQTRIVFGEEIVVTALGIKQQKRSLTYSAQNVDLENSDKARSLNLVNSLSGKVAGLTITRGGDGVGTGSRVNLRGVRSLNGGNGPLLVVDGVIVRDISDLNSNDIASVNVLKGANAAALYGSEAQNGVIIMTTKKGKYNEVHVDLYTTYMQRRPVILTDFQNVYGQGVAGKYSPHALGSWGPKLEGQMVNQWSNAEGKAGTQYAFLPQPDRNRNIYRTGYSLDNGVTASIGGDKMTGLVSYRHTLANGILPGNKLDQNNATVRVTAQITSRLSIDTKISYINKIVDNSPLTSNAPANPVLVMALMPRNIRIADLEQYSYTKPGGTTIFQNSWSPDNYQSNNPYWIFNNFNKSNLGERVLLLASAKYDITNHLSLQVRTDYDGANSTFQWRIHNGSYETGPNGYFQVTKSKNFNYSADFLLRYQRLFNKDWNIDISIGGKTAKHRNNVLDVATPRHAGQLNIPNLFTFANASVINSNFNYGSPGNKQSLYGLAKVGWKDNLYLNLTGRNDWTSTLPPDSRSFFYPSVGMAAILSSLIPNFPKTISFAKISASYAKVGQGTSPFLTHRYINFEQGGKHGFASLSGTAPAEDLKPEKTTSLELGAIVNFFNNRLGLNATIYKTNTQNQLFSVSVPVGSGANTIFVNAGNVQNKGLEVQLTGAPVQLQDFKWDMAINYSMNRNEIKEIYGGENAITLSAHNGNITFRRIQVGDPVGLRYVQGFVRDDEGRVIVDDKGLPKITKGHTVLAGSFQPDWRGSIYSSLSYKNLTFDFLITHRQGGTMIDYTNSWLTAEGLTGRTLKGRENGVIFGKDVFSNEVAVDKTGKPNDTKISPERLWGFLGGRINAVGEPFIESATNTRMKEMSFTYSFPKSLLKGLPISKVKISLVARNVFFIYRNSNFDPNVLSGTGLGDLGITKFTLPNTRRYGFSINIGF